MRSCTGRSDRAALYPEQCLRDRLDVRSDLGTLNLSDVPTVMVELGNMRNARDAHRMTTAGGRATYARALTRAARHFLHAG